jgi:hypothetical protein
MTRDGPSYSIEPIAPDQVPARFRALLDRLEPVLSPGEVIALRGLVDRGEHEAAFARLDAITNDGTVLVDTATLIEIVLLGQAVRAA